MTKVNTLILLLLTTAVASCTTTPEKANKPLLSGIYFENMDSTVNPGDDFHQFVNGKWLNETEIPADKSSYGVDFIVHEEAEENVKKIIEESASGKFETGSNEQMVGDLYKSFMDMDKRNELGVQPLQDEFEDIDAISNYKELARHFGRTIQYTDVPFSYGIFPDLKEPSKYGLYYFQSGLGLPDMEYYSKQDDKSIEIRQKYKSHIAAMFELAGLDDASRAADNIIALETKMASINMRKEDTRNPANLYNKYPVDSLSYLMPSFSWKDFLDESGVADMPEVIIGMVDYCKAFDRIFSSTNLAIWKQYLKWMVLNAFDPYLNQAIDDQNFEFYGKTLYGRQEQRPQWRRAVSVVNSNLGEVVGKVYVERHFPAEAKRRMDQLVANLIEAYRTSIKELDWMSDSTKIQALDKLSKFTPKIGYPDIWKDYSGLEIKADDIMGNKKRADITEYNRSVSKLKGPIQKHEWGMSPQTVNAYYNPTLNEIVFPAAILQPPYFDLTVEDAVNYGAIGAVIGHEIGHGFDDSGSQFDGDGQMRNWWTDEDRSSFDERTAALIAQFNGYRVFDDLNVNGTFTLGENIGDLGGLSIALKAYEMSLNGEEGPVLDGITAKQRVFIGYAQAWRKKSREESLRVQVNSDPHSPAEFRVNGIVRNIPAFYEAFNVTELDSLFLPSKDRIKIW